MNKHKTILHLCADIGSDSKPYKDAGYDVRLIGKDIGVENYNPPDNVYGIIANPVCKEFSTANYSTVKDINKGLKMVYHCLRIKDMCSPTFWVLENPATGTLKNSIGKPKFVYQPWEYGSPWTKKTALWGEFNIPKKLYNNWKDVPKIGGLYIRPGRKPSLAFMHKSHKKLIREFDAFNVEDDMSFRSLCSQGFAEAFFKVNQ